MSLYPSPVNTYLVVLPSQGQRPKAGTTRTASCLSLGLKKQEFARHTEMGMRMQLTASVGPAICPGI
jgi:hypothetical protein